MKPTTIPHCCWCWFITSLTLICIFLYRIIGLCAMTVTCWVCSTKRVPLWILILWPTRRKTLQSTINVIWKIWLLTKWLSKHQLQLFDLRLEFFPIRRYDTFNVAIDQNCVTVMLKFMHIIFKQQYLIVSQSFWKGKCKLR